MKKSAVDRLDELIDDVDDFRERIFGVTNETLNLAERDTSSNGSFSTSNSSLSEANLDSSPLLKLSSDINGLLSRDLLEGDTTFNDFDHGWINLIKSFPLQRNIKQGIVTHADVGFNQPLPTLTPSKAPNFNLVYRTDLKIWITIPEDNFNFTTLPKVLSFGPKPFVSRNHSFKFGRKKKSEGRSFIMLFRLKLSKLPYRKTQSH